MEYDYDFAVIGGGSAGYAGARTAYGRDLKTAVIDGAEHLGGLCILRGCMPSKTLIESANRARIIREADAFGLRAAWHGADPAAIRDRKRALIAEFADYRRGQLEDGRFDLLRGRASFVDPHTVSVAMRDGSTRTVRARAFLIASGSVMNRVDVPGLEGTGYLTSDEVLDSDHIPASVIVLGGGAIALELAGYYEGLGCAVAVIQRSPQVMPELDADVAQALEAGIRRHGVQLYTGTQLLRAARTEGGKSVTFAHEGNEVTVEAEEIICALGRRPATDGMGLENAGVTTQNGRITTNELMQCGAEHLYAAGDVCSPHEVVHVAIQQGELAARNAAVVLGDHTDALEEIDYSLHLFAAFSRPEVAIAGLTEKAARARGLTFQSATYPFNDHGKSMVMGEIDGLVKLTVEKDSRRILGGAVVGPHASEMIHEIIVALRFGCTAGQLAAIPHYHPTLSEIWTYPAEDLA